MYKRQGINQLDDPFGISSEANSISPNASFIGGQLDFFDADTFETGTQAAVWGGEGFTLTLLTWEGGSRVLGKVLDISNAGYAVGETTDGRGFIWHSSFDGVQIPFVGTQIFDDWLESIPEGATLPSASSAVVAVAEEPETSSLLFAVSGSASSCIVTVPIRISALLGDVNEDGSINFSDIAPFIDVLSNGEFQDEADIDENGTVDFMDISPFIGLLINQ